MNLLSVNSVCASMECRLTKLFVYVVVIHRKGDFLLLYEQLCLVLWSRGGERAYSRWNKRFSVWILDSKKEKKTKQAPLTGWKGNSLKANLLCWNFPSTFHQGYRDQLTQNSHRKKTQKNPLQCQVCCQPNSFVAMNNPWPSSKGQFSPHCFAL